MVNSQLLANPSIDASSTRYSTSDGGAAALLNRTTAWFRLFVPVVPISGSIYEVRGHSPGSAGRDAEFYLNDGVTNIAAEEPYVVGTDAPPTQSIALKQLSARVDIRDYTQILLSEEYDETHLQKEGMVQAIWANWEQACMVGDAGTTPQEFDGLSRLVTLGLGQAFASTTGDLRDFTGAMRLIKSHNRSVDLIVMNQDGWRKVDRLMRSGGYQLDYRNDMRGGTRLQVLHFCGIPICISDHIPTDTVANTTPIYFMTLGKPNGVFAIAGKRCQEVKFTPDRRAAAPFASVQALYFAALVSTTDDALVQLTDFPTTLT